MGLTCYTTRTLLGMEMGIRDGVITSKSHHSEASYSNVYETILECCKHDKKGFSPENFNKKSIRLRVISAF